MVIITNLGQRQKSALNAENITGFYRCLLYVVFHNLEPQNAGLVDVKRVLHLTSSNGIFVRENLKNKHPYQKCNLV